MAIPEPELPGALDTPSSCKLSAIDRIQSLFTRRKLPGWVLVIWVVFQGVPDWKSRIDFWLDAAKAAGGYTSEAASVIGSPYFSVAMAVVGLLWLTFAGGPKRGVLCDPR
jgi:hypothetical protein